MWCVLNLTLFLAVGHPTDMMMTLGMYYWYMYALDTADLIRQRGETGKANGYSVDVEAGVNA